jgi:hypothetical protein
MGVTSFIVRTYNNSNCKSIRKLAIMVVPDYYLQGHGHTDPSKGCHAKRKYLVGNRLDCGFDFEYTGTDRN